MNPFPAGGPLVFIVKRKVDHGNHWAIEMETLPLTIGRPMIVGNLHVTVSPEEAEKFAVGQSYAFNPGEN